MPRRRDPNFMTGHLEDDRLAGHMIPAPSWSTQSLWPGQPGGLEKASRSAGGPRRMALSSPSQECPRRAPGPSRGIERGRIWRRRAIGRLRNGRISTGRQASRRRSRRSRARRSRAAGKGRQARPGAPWRGCWRGRSWTRMPDDVLAGIRRAQPRALGRGQCRYGRVAPPAVVGLVYASVLHRH